MMLFRSWLDNHGRKIASQLPVSSPSQSPALRFTKVNPVSRLSLRHHRWWALLAILISTGLVTSCSLLGVKKEVKQLNAHGAIAVEVSNLSISATNYALALSAAGNQTNEMVGFQTVGPDGLAVFLLRQNRTYAVGAFSDLNGNGTYDGGEPVCVATNIQPASLSDTGARAKPIALRLASTNGLPRGQRFMLPRENLELGEALPIALGAIADLDDPKFSSAAGESGMWQPYDFIQRYGVGVYFLEPYTPKKIPVMFVYGISGSVQDWRVILEKMDRQKYQPWLFQYPSGLRLDKSANALSSAMLLLKQRHGFERIYVVAHSMGGLVSRGAIQRTVTLAGTNFIPHFVTISTPWGGHQAAELAVKHLKFPVPSWRDMAPGSEYLTEIFSQPLPAGTRHDLLFSYKSSSSLGLPSENDGVVAVTSELKPEVQEQAGSVLGVFEDHMGILASPITLKRVQEALAR